MNFEQILKACTPHPNGTYDIYPVIRENEVVFLWGNSMLPTLDPYTKNLEAIVGRAFEMNPNRKAELLKLPNVLLRVGEK